jgi:ABC-type uncharacterized transport system permease subunit
LGMAWAFANTKWGLIVRMTGDSAQSAKAMGVSVDLVRFLCTTAGGFLAGGRASAALFCRFIIPDPGTRACLPAKASWR